MLVHWSHLTRNCMLIFPSDVTSRMLAFLSELQSRGALLSSTSRLTKSTVHLESSEVKTLIHKRMYLLLVPLLDNLRVCLLLSTLIHPTCIFRFCCVYLLAVHPSQLHTPWTHLLLRVCAPIACQFMPVLATMSCANYSHIKSKIVVFYLESVWLFTCRHTAGCIAKHLAYLHCYIVVPNQGYCLFSDQILINHLGKTDNEHQLLQFLRDTTTLYIHRATITCLLKACKLSLRCNL